MNTLIAVDKDVAEWIFGWRPGRPTISRRAGRVIARLTGMGVQQGTDVFHMGLVLLGFGVITAGFGCLRRR